MGDDRVHHRSREPGVGMLKQLRHIQPRQLPAETIVRGQHVAQRLTALRRTYQQLLQELLRLVLTETWRKARK